MNLTEQEAGLLAQTGSHGIPFVYIPDHTLIRRIGGGSYGEIWLARNALGTYRAVKIVYRKNFAHDRPFEREFGGIQKYEPISRSLDGLMDILQVGRNNEAGYFYYVMELADDVDSGAQITPESYAPRTLAHELSKRQRLPFEECLGIGLALSSALAQLHKHGLVHRDVKPSNIIFVNGVPELADIGLVTDIEEARSYVGTEGFIPPEGPGAAQADIYSLGKVLYEISTGKDRFEYPELPSSLDDTASQHDLIELNEIVIKACRADTHERYQSADKMHADLLLLQRGRSIKQVRKLQRRLALATRVGIVAIVAALLALGAWLGSIRQIQRARKAEQDQSRFRKEAEEARRDATDKLWASYLAEARSRRISGQSGRRFESLRVIREAAAIRPSVELRNEAIASLVLADLQSSGGKDFAKGTQKVVPDTRFERYAVAEPSGSVTVRREFDGSELACLPGMGPAPASHMFFSPDGMSLAVLYADDRIRLWDWVGQAILHEFQSGKALAFTSDSKRLAISDATNIFVHELAGGKRVGAISLNHLAYPRQSGCFCFDPAGHLLALYRTEAGANVFILNTDSGKTLMTLPHADAVWDVEWHPDGRHLATACNDGLLYLWDTIAGKAIKTAEASQTVSLAFNRKGNLLASSGWDGKTRLWDFPRIQHLVSVYKSGNIFGFSPDDTRLVLQEWDGTDLQFFEVAGGFGLSTLHEREPGKMSVTGSAFFDSSGRFLAYPTAVGVNLWDAQEERIIGTLPAIDTYPVGFDAQQNLLLNGPEGLFRWPIDDSTRGKRISPGRPVFLLPLNSGGPVSADGKFCAIREGSRWRLLRTDSFVELARTGEQLAGHSGSMSPNGSLLATGAWHSPGVKVWNTQTGDLVKELPADDDRNDTTTVAFNADGRYLVISVASEYCFWEVGSWSLARRIPQQPGNDFPAAMAFSRDGKIFAGTHSRILVRLYDAATAQVLADLEAPNSGPITSLSFNHDGTQLAVCEGCTALRIWDLRSIRKRLADMGLDWDVPP
jgi:WD40 repeat protein